MVNVKFLALCFSAYGLFSCGCRQEYVMPNGAVCKYRWIENSYSECTDGFVHRNAIDVRSREVCSK